MSHCHTLVLRKYSNLIFPTFTSLNICITDNRKRRKVRGRKVWAGQKPRIQDIWSGTGDDKIKIAAIWRIAGKV